MQKLSIYNYLLDSDKIGKFIYNSRTNSFIKISDRLFDKLNSKNIDIELLPENIKSKFEDLKVIVDEAEDIDYFYNKKLAKYVQSFSTQQLILTIATTTKCNFRCPYCYEIGTLKYSSTETINNNIIKYIEKKDAQNIQICWYGGEPLLNFKSIKYITEILKNQYNGKKISYSIVTNGYLLTKEIVEFFKKYKLSQVQITIDGLKETNDKTRILANGKGTFDVIIKNLKYAVQEMNDTIFSIRVNVDKTNIDEYPKLHKFLREELNTSNLYIYHSYITDYTNNLPNCINRHQEFQYNLLLAKEHKIIDFHIYPQFELGGCSADSMNYHVIDPKGHLYKCWNDIGREDRITGTILEKDNIKINYALLSRYIVGSNMYDDEKCKSCFLFPVCKGGCAYHRMRNVNTSICPIIPKDIGSYLELHYQNLTKP